MGRTPDGYCHHEHTEESLENNTYYKTCNDCADNWSYGEISDITAAIVRTALKFGASWPEAWRASHVYEKNDVHESDHQKVAA